MLNIHLFAPKIKKLFGNRAGQLSQPLRLEGSSASLSVFAPKPKLFAKGTQTVPDERLCFITSSLGNSFGNWAGQLSPTLSLMRGGNCALKHLSLPDFDPAIHEKTSTVPVVRWIPGSSPGMTIK